MKLQKILDKLEERYPLSCAEEWDNPGLLVGRRDADVRCAVVALDVTDAVIDLAVETKAQLVLTHHPLIFGALRNVSTDHFLGGRILRLAENGIATYAMHTNFDIRKMADLNAAQLQLANARVLDVTGLDAYDLEEGLGKVGELAHPMALSEFALFVKKQMNVDEVRLYGPADQDPEVHTIAVCGGSGKSTIPCAVQQGAQVLVTGDIDYHSAIDALSEGLYLIDAGHYGTESCFIAHMAGELAELVPDLEIHTAPVVQPFRLV